MPVTEDRHSWSLDPGLRRDDEMVSGPTFIADPPDARIAVPLETLVAVFHTPSGQTHLLASPAPEILAALASGPADADGILARLAADHAIDVDGARDAIAARLCELEASGLVRRA